MRDLDFTPYAVIRAPLAPEGWPNVWRHSPEADAARVWGSSLSSVSGVTTASHAFALATDELGSPVVLVEHGGGREVIALSHGAWGLPEAMLEGFAAMDDRALYATLYTIHDVARKAADKAREATAMRYGHAFLEGRLKKTRKGGTISLKIATGYQPTVNGEHFSPTSYKTATDATIAGEREAERRGLTDAKIGWVGRS